jgi:outer membrane protein
MRKIVFFFILLLPFSIHAQEFWSLKKCIDYALENNLQVKQTKLNQNLSEENLLRSKAATLPTLNGFASHNYNFGRTIDPFTNQFATQTVQSNSFSLSAGLLIFNGFQTINNIRQNNFALMASKFDLEKIKNDIALAVISAYLNVLYLDEQLAIAQAQVELSQKQFDRINLMLQTGSVAKGTMLDMQAQLANDELQKVTIQNQLDIAYLTLSQLMELPANETLKIEKPEIILPAETSLGNSPSQIYQAALANQPDIKAAEYRLNSAFMGVKSARGAYAPRLTISAAYGTGYSGLRKEPIGSPVLNGFDTIGVTTSFDYVLVPNYSFDTRITPFNKQLDDNQNRTIGVNLVVPLFNGLQARSATSTAKIQRANAELTLESTKRQLEKTIQQAHADANAAYKKYQASEKSVTALTEAFKYIEQRFNVGMVNTIDFNDAKNKMARSQAELSQAKFDYVFKVKILDFYQGKAIGL